MHLSNRTKEPKSHGVFVICHLKSIGLSSPIDRKIVCAHREYQLHFPQTVLTPHCSTDHPWRGGLRLVDVCSPSDRFRPHPSPHRRQVYNWEYNNSISQEPQPEHLLCFCNRIYNASAVGPSRQRMRQFVRVAEQTVLSH